MLFSKLEVLGLIPSWVMGRQVFIHEQPTVSFSRTNYPEGNSFLLELLLTESSPDALLS
ncbi:hypothetical protein HOLleu_37093 [Holothuria leucospilota]|uniref:Uncharacterized protein n=1 Tax=Holothuria leucospilota TaxID=206669 RepID=A0A9Q0YGE1_HOLLE|nr:hypothetical protein HOLleu_37093 [Holothuria leucospilota]